MPANQPDTVFTNFKLATFAPAGTELAGDVGQRSFKQPAGNYGAIEDCSMGVSNGKIVWIQPSNAVDKASLDADWIDGQGKWLTPGLIDCHTHLVYGGNRANEWEDRLNGVSYEQIARDGGGILSTVRQTRTASIDELTELARPRLSSLLKEGVTTVEIKSGYGLDLETELKMLQAANRLQQSSEVSIVTTLLAAHSVPPEFQNSADKYIELVCDQIIPAAKEFCSAVDAFCESIAFSVEQTVKVLEAAQRYGLDIKVHAEQLTNTGIAVRAAKMGALSVDHLEFLTAHDCEKIATTDTVATLLPGAYYFLNEKQTPPVESLRESKIPMAIATDSNPGSSPMTSLLLAGNMACQLFRLTPHEALAGMTINAAKALGIENRVGSLQPGRLADLAVWDIGSPAELLYNVGQNPCIDVYRSGRLRK